MSASDAAAVDVVSLETYWRFLRRQWPVLCAGVVVGALLGLSWYLAAPASYEARATVTIDPITSELFASGPANQMVNTETELAILRSGEVAGRAATAEGRSADPGDLLDNLRVVVPGSSFVFDVFYTAETPQEAARMADAFATSYLAFRQETAEARRDAYIGQLQLQLAELSDQLAALPAVARDADFLGEEIGVVRQQLSDATTLTISPGRQVSAASAEAATRSPGLVVPAAGGVALGLLLGLAAALLRHRRDDRVRFTDEIPELCGLPVLGRVPGQRGTADPAQSDVIALAAMRLVSPRFADGARSWLIVRADVGAATGAEEIATVIGRTDRVTLLQRTGGPVTGPTTGRDDPEEATDGGDDSPGLRRTTGLSGAEVSLLMESPRTADGYTIVDGQGLGSMTEALSVVNDVGAVLVVVELKVTRRGDLVRLVDEIRYLNPDRLAPGVLVIERGARLATPPSPATETANPDRGQTQAREARPGSPRKTDGAREAASGAKKSRKPLQRTGGAAPGSKRGGR